MKSNWKCLTALLLLYTVAWTAKAGKFDDYIGLQIKTAKAKVCVWRNCSLGSKV